MPEFSDRLALPFLAAGQAQKEVWHNEALILLDSLVQTVVKAVAPASVPTTPMFGECLIVGPTPSGAWAGKAQQIACWTSGGWRFVIPLEGMACWNIAGGVTVRFSGGAWAIGIVTANELRIGSNKVVGARLPAISDPTGGATPDTESRIAVGAILAAMRTHGLISA